MRLLLTILIFISISYSGQSQVDNYNHLSNGLVPGCKGDWLITILPDTLQANKEVLSWKNIFYGFLLLTIDESNTMILSGNMDQGPLNFTTIDTVSFKLSPEWGNTKYTYSRENDLIYLGDEPYSRTFKRLSNDKMIDTIRDSKKLMEYVINKIFIDKYLPQDFTSNIEYISLGLETYTPFTFDAIGIRNQNGELEYFGWEYISDTLKLYKTTSTFDENSGFRYFIKGELDRQYFKK